MTRRFPKDPSDKEILDRLIDRFGGDFLCCYGSKGHNNETNVWVEKGKVSIMMPGLSEKQATKVLEAIEKHSTEFNLAGALNYDPGDEDIEHG